MFKALMARFHQGHRTTKYPDSAAQVPELFRGYPRLHHGPCAKECQDCEESCPTGALTCAGTPSLDLGACLFCAECPAHGDTGCLRFTADPALAATSRENLVITPETERRYAQALDERLRKLFGRSLKLREVSAGGCNACEADTNVLSTIGFDIGRFGIQFVASPRHADGIFVTGPVTENMRVALLKTYEAIPEPKIVIASGACAISGGPFIGSPEQHHGVATFLPVDLFIPGCPPHPITILDGLLRLLGRMKDQPR